MKNKQFTIMNVKRLRLLGIMLIATTFLFRCSEDPKKENTPELITKATLTFTPTGGGSAIVVTATDPDGTGIQAIAADGDINLAVNTTYTLTLTLINELASPSDPEYNLSDEVEEEGDEHMFFFSWTGNVFSDPTGDGNIDTRSDIVNYTGGANSVDANNLPLGLTTTWTASAGTSSGSSFRLLLKHQPDLKSDTSTSSAGETDLDITFTINII
jgi:hypothetical protein